MKTLIAYAGRSGSTEEVARAMKVAVGPDAVILDLASGSDRKAAAKLDVKAFDAVILGGGIRVGKMPGAIVKFASENATLLGTRKLGLFVCCLDEEKASEFMTAGFGVGLVSAAARAEWMGGRYRPEDHGRLIQALMRKIRESDDPVDTLRTDAVPAFVQGVLS